MDVPQAMREQCAALLATETPDRGALCELLRPAVFADPGAAHRRLRRLAEGSEATQAMAGTLPHLLSALADAADPDRVLVSLDRYLARSRDRPATLRFLARTPRAVQILVTLFSGSQFLTEILLRNPEYLERLVEHRQLAQPLDVNRFCARAAQALAECDDLDEPLDALRRYQRWELLRIGACDLLGLIDLAGVTGQLSNLADSLVRTCLSIASSRTGTPADGFVVIAMGKLGGQELNYSSDIDLLFLTSGPSSDYRRLGERLIAALTQVTAEGFLYRVDMRLRPWGSSGALVSLLDGYLAYLRDHARLWEKQALLKARPIAGDLSIGEAFLQRIEPLLFDVSPASVRADVRDMKARTEAYLRQNGREWGEVKLGEGSIRDVEFVVQYLQLVHGATHPEVRSRTTLDALGRLLAAGLLSPDAHRVLVDGYVFLRTIEHHLQMMHYRQTHTLPGDAGAIAHLAQRLGFQDADAGDRLLVRYEEHRAAIRAIYIRYLGSDEMNGAHNPELATPPPSVHRHVARMDPSYAAMFSRDEIELHAALAERLDEDNLVEVYASLLADERWRVTIVGYDYPGVLSLICGLLFVYGLGIDDGEVFTYEPAPDAPGLQDWRRRRARTSARRKIVDVFTVRPSRGQVDQGTWARYADELSDLMRLMHAGQRQEAQGALARSLAGALYGSPQETTLYPVDIEIDNQTSAQYTVLRIDAPDTIGFLYEFTNALALTGIYISRVTVDSTGSRVQDTLYVTDAAGAKITDPDKERELRAATVLIKHFTHLLPFSPNPESALLHFRQFLGQLFRREDWPNELATLERSEVLQALAQVLGVSDFLWDDFLRMQHTNLFPVVRDVDALATAKSRAQLQSELEAELARVHPGPQAPSERAPWRAALNAFKDREMFRIDMRHILGHTAEFWDFAEELTALAEVVVNAAYHLCHEDLRSVYGTPCLVDGAVSEMTVCALGKCGGRELGFASDIELMFIYAGNGQTSGPNAITTAEFYEKVVQTFVSAIQAKREGIFEIDLQLRPYGKAGSMAVSLEAFRRYFAPDGPAWAYERQALVKLRPIAGNPELGEQVLALRDRFVYQGEPFDVAAMRAMRERQVRHLVVGGTFNAKYSPGGLVDVEYLVQGLQIAHGHQRPELRRTNIREAMAALADADILSPDDYAQLRRAHTFLRWLIDGLRMVRGNARDLTVPPPGSEAFAFLARRLRYGNDATRAACES